jgi:hypothetical protein
MRVVCDQKEGKGTLDKNSSWKPVSFFFFFVDYIRTPTCANVPCNYSKYFSQRKGTHFCFCFFIALTIGLNVLWDFFLNESYKRGRVWLSEKICLRTHLKLNTYSETRWGGSTKNPCCFVGRITCWSRGCPGWPQARRASLDRSRDVPRKHSRTTYLWKEKLYKLL